MERRRVVTALAIALTGLPVPASMPLPIPLKELYGAAEAVAVVEVIEGRLVSAGGDMCGARYKGRVLEGIKGAKPGLVVEFGFLPSLKVGGSYLLFLGGYESVYIPGAPDFLARCKSVQRLWRTGAGHLKYWATPRRWTSAPPGPYGQ
jgi:hypothetical protein